MPLQGDLGTLDDYARSAVAAHRVESNRDAFAQGALPSRSILSLRKSLSVTGSLHARRNTRTKRTDGAAA
jgi:hypothetical protein